MNIFIMFLKILFILAYNNKWHQVKFDFSKYTLANIDSQMLCDAYSIYATR